MWNIPSKIPTTFSCHHESCSCFVGHIQECQSRQTKMQHSSLGADLGKVQLQGVVQYHTESLEHVIVSSLSPRQDSAVQVMRPELGETFEIKRLLKILSFIFSKVSARYVG